MDLGRAYAVPRGRLRALWERNSRVSDTQSMVKKGVGGAGFRWAHPLDPKEPMPCAKVTTRGEPEWSFL